MSFRRLTHSIALLSCVLFVPAQAGETKRPNVVILLTDDNGYGDLSCHGNPVLKTPNFDRLHAQSVRLTDFHVAPICTPTRGQLLTGKDALHNGATSVSAGRSFIRRGIPSMAELFAAAGYRTAMFGKWHLGDSFPNLPNDRGFQEAVYHLGWGITSMADLWQNDYFDGRFRHNGTLTQYRGYCTDVWFDLAMSWVGESQKKNKPFFLYLPTNAAHGPHWVPERYKTPYKGRGPAAFLGMMANLDENLGRFEEFLEFKGLKENTIFIYLNDNGATAGAQVYNAGMRGRKTQYYEGGHRAACFVRWPAGDLRKPSDLDALTEVQDLLPTLIDLAKLPSPGPSAFDGVSLADLLRGTTETLTDRILVVQYGQKPAKWDCAVLSKKWRLVHGEELYDLSNDPGQTKDVARQHPEVVARLREHYEHWWADTAPELDNFTPIVLGSDREDPVTLSAADWANVYCDNMNDLRTGKPSNGPWHVLPVAEGTYTIELRRWPKEADAAIAAGVPAFSAVDGKLQTGKALPIARARLKIGDMDETRPVPPDAKAITFTVNLKSDIKLPMQSWFYDENGGEICGAYFAYVSRESPESR
ncbi:arylsulfatase [Singulisphaera sp. Ch08]|uniref:Arylsulfatase n=1 Tax=Singulisphaera sp. Ch08 TaxID=3120278 RepID=A0AAU7CDV1_9BACT